MTASTAADPQAQWLQMGRQRLEQTLQAKISANRSADGLTLEPAREGGAGATDFGPGEHQVDRRAKTDRRVVYDRRQLIRFEDDRRAGVDRRAGNEAWLIP